MEASPPKRRKFEHHSAASFGQNGSGFDIATMAGMFGRGSFVLETEELLKEVGVDYEETFAGADDLLHRLKSAIEAIEPHDATPIIGASASLEKAHRIRVPFPTSIPPDSPYKVCFAVPSQINVVGSYVTRTMVKSDSSNIDMIVEMARDMFQEKDYLNHRYFYKRAYYLAKLAVGVRSFLGADVNLSYEYLHGNALVPVLSVKPKGEGGRKATGAAGATKPGSHTSSPKYRIRIIPCAPEGLFPSMKLLPTSNCIRGGVSEGKPEHLAPTPFYNSTLKAEGCFLAYLRVLRHAEKTCPSFKSVCILGRVWLEQRGFTSAIYHGGFGHFEFAVLTALLLQRGGSKGAAALPSSLSGTQLFKALIQFLAKTDFVTKPLVFGDSRDGAEGDTCPVIFDSARQFNVAFKMSLSSATLLRQHAIWTHALLANDLVDQLYPAFIARASTPLQMFDMIVHIKNRDLPVEENTTEYRGPSWAFADKAYRILKRALGERASLIHAYADQTTGESAWNIASSPPPLTPDVFFGILFDPANMSKLVDHGPSVEDKKEAKKFRQFWGEKAELRRFKDGSILESLIWTQTSAPDLCEEIVRYILWLHLRVQGDKLGFCGKAFSSVARHKATDSAAFSAARQAFETFERDIRNLDDLPLHVRQLAPTCPEMRSTSVRPPSLDTQKAPVKPMDVAISFESSGKWPDNLTAIQRTKIAFLLRIGALLEESKPGVRAYLGLDDVETEIENLAFLDIVYESGGAFRLRIHSDHEENLLEARTRDKSLEQHIRTEAAVQLQSVRRVYTHLPLHTQMMSTFCSRFPALSPTIRALKGWFNAHKLSSHFFEEFVELVALHVFLEPYPWQAPSSAMTGFLRALLFLSRWDWRVEPLIVGPESASAADRRLEAWRKIDPNMNHTTLVVTTSYDASGTTSTVDKGHPAPSKVVATRMTALARSACKLVREKGVELDLKALFQPSLKDYDVLIHMDTKVVKSILRKTDGLKQSQFKNLDGRTGQTPTPLAHDPVQAFLRQLNKLYAAPLVFFHGGPDDDIIACIWNPSQSHRTFRVNLPCSFRPVGKNGKSGADEDDDLVEVNREAILAEIARLGGDLVARVETKE